MLKRISKRIIYFNLFIFIIISICSVSFGVSASAPFVTQTLNRYNELVETQDAYDPVLNIKSYEKDGKNYTFSNPKDLFIDDNDYFYICDTGNKRIVVLNSSWEYITEFGETELIKPMGLYVRNDFVYVCDYGDNNISDVITGKVVKYHFDKESKTVTVVNQFGRPESELLKIDNFLYRPMKIAVDSNETMYIVCQGSSNGILLCNKDNRFLNYFAPNSASGEFLDLVKDFLYGNNENVILNKRIAAAPANVMLDDSGYIYTVTQTVVQNDLGDTLKKVNIGGLNFYPADMLVSSSFVDSWSSNHKTVYALTTGGYIYEYDIEGNLLFLFSGPIGNDEQLGLFQTASALAVNSKDEIFVIDDTTNSIQVFRKTEFTNNVHQALELYMTGRYAESKEYWEKVLQYNSMFDLAHKGIGMAYYLERDYTQAMEKFKICNAKDEYSEAFWEQRNLWLMSNITTLVIIVVSILICSIVIVKTNKKYQYLAPITNKVTKFTERPKVKSVLMMSKFIRHPLDAVYFIRYDKKIKIYNALIIFVLILGIYVLSLTYTGFLFTDIVLEKTILLKELTKVALPIILFIFSNYLISSLMSGEGSLRCITLNTMGSLLPILIMMPFIILISNVLTNNESFLYYFMLVIMFAWTFVLLFVVIKETHNYTIKQTISNFLLTFIMMIIIIIVMILVYLVCAQVIEFVIDLFKEVVFRG